MMAKILATLIALAFASCGAGVSHAADCSPRANTSCNPSKGATCCASAGLACIGSDKQPTDGAGTCKAWAGTTPSTTPPTSTTSTTRPPSSSTTTSTTRPPGTTTTSTLPPVVTSVCRPPGADISARIERQNFELYFNRSSPNVRFADQQERDCMEQARIFAIKQLIVNVGDLAPTARDKALDCLSLLYTRIGVICPYQGCTHRPKGAVWLHNTPGGRDYQCSGAALSAFRDELTSPRVRVAAALRLASATDLRNTLDVDATLTGPAPFTYPPPPKSDTAKRAQQVPIDTRIKMPPCGGGNGCVDLDMTVHAHHCSMLAKIGAPVPADCDGVPGVSIAQARYEAGCGDDRNCQWFRRLDPFSGFEDRSTWAPPQLVQLAKLTHVTHERCWAVAQRAGNAPDNERCDRQHDILHTMENIGRGWLIVWPADGVEPDEYLQHQGDRMTPEQLLPVLVAAYRVQ